MSNILKYYKNTFTLMLKLGFVWVESWGAYDAIKEVQNSWDFITNEEWNRLKSKYEKKDLKTALQKLQNEWFGFSGSEKVTDEIVDLLNDWNEGIDTTTRKTRDNLWTHKESVNYTIENKNQQVVLDFINKYWLEAKNASHTEIRKLQKALKRLWYKLKGKNHGVDWAFGRTTKAALIKASQYTWDTPITSENYSNKVSTEAVNTQIDKTYTSVTDLENKLKVTAELNKNLENYFFRENAWYSIEALLRKVFGGDKFAKMKWIADNYETVISQPWNKDKLEKAIKYLSIHNEDILNDNRPLSNTWKSVMKETMKVLPWLFWIYLGDIPLPFITEITKWADINKSVAFKNWIKDGMKWDFSNYYNKHKTKIDVIENQNSLLDKLASLNIPSAEKSKLLAWRINELTAKTRELITTYIKVRLIPDLKVMQKASYNVFERWFLWIFSDEKYDKWQEKIKELQQAVQNGNNDLDIANKVLELLQKEWDVNISHTRNRQEYMKRVQDNNDKIETISELLAHPKLKVFKNIFKFVSVEDLTQLWVNESDANSLRQLEWILDTRPIDIHALSQFERRNPSTMRFIKALWNKKEMQRYLLSKIPQNRNLKRIHVGLKHGTPLTWNNETDYDKAILESPDGKHSTLALAYRSAIQKGDITWISYEDYANAYRNKYEVWADEINNNISVINTWAPEGREAVEKLKHLLRWGKKIYKLEPIVKTYSYYEWENIVTATVEYNSYIKSDCSNPIIVPWSVTVDKTVNQNPEFDTTTNIWVDGKLPVVIPWFVFKHGGNWWTENSHSTPGEQRGGSNGWGWGIPSHQWGWR